MFTSDEKDRIVIAIREAETNTSGEVKVHVERQCPTDPLERAKEIFVKLSLHQTQLRNGVLFYVALDDHKFAILGDSGIHEVVPPDFWESTKELMRGYFRASQIAEGICVGIAKAGQQLKSHFPYQANDSNELSDEISFGD